VEANSWSDFRVQASQKPARIILADGQDPRVIEAAKRARALKIADPLLITPEMAGDASRWIKTLRNLPKYKALSEREAAESVKDPLILGCLMLREGLADGFIGGATRTTADTLRAVFTIVGLAPRTSTLFGFFLIEGQGGRLVLLADCAVTPEPSPKQLAHIGIGAAEAYEFYTGQTPQVAFLSFSTHGSAQHSSVEKVRQALEMARAKAPSLALEGEWQPDAALDLFSAQIKGVGPSSMAGHANVLIVPDLNSGNIAYKLVQRLGGCRAVGPVLWGTARPANDLSRGCSSEDVLDMLALTTLQTRKRNSMEKITYGR
jgi:phosphate acetyltransferase